MNSRDLITRKIPTTEITVMCVNTRTQEVTTFVYTVVGKKYPDDVKSEILENRLLKLASDRIKKQSLKPVKVTKITVTEQLYGITVEQFIKYAVMLDNETRQAIPLTKEEN